MFTTEGDLLADPVYRENDLHLTESDGGKSIYKHHLYWAVIPTTEEEMNRTNNIPK